MWNFPLFPDTASTMAPWVDYVSFYVGGLVVFFTTLICFLILYFAIKYRRGSRASRANAATHNLALEIAWSVIPLTLAMILFVTSTWIFFHMYVPPKDAAEVYVLGRQWMWELRHPEGKREINELHIPVGRPVRLVMTSQDVIHSFFVPAFRAKQDVVPGRYTSIWFEPTRVGRYHIFCAEYCGTEHSGMIGWVEVMEPSAYEEWLESGAVTASMASEGQQLFSRLGCSGCHGVNATVRAPLLDGVYGRPVPLESGEVINADERYVRDSILLPRSQVVAGYKPVMPTFEGHISEDELLKIIAYIKALGKNERIER
jgi:cytochrome c oxidase subunit 2